ncbi:MAG: hypothetical protein DSY88_11155 [Candidatus Poseidoniales archaeon]|nr:MAG: hypothetical protein DSY88_11155 [Candidatus Poseidoniales archaeon]
MSYAGDLRSRSRLVGSVGRVGEPVLERPAETTHSIYGPSSGHERRVLERVPCVGWAVHAQIRVVLPLVNRDTAAGMHRIALRGIGEVVVEVSALIGACAGDNLEVVDEHAFRRIDGGATVARTGEAVREYAEA